MLSSVITSPEINCEVPEKELQRSPETILQHVAANHQSLKLVSRNYSNWFAAHQKFNLHTNVLSSFNKIQNSNTVAVVGAHQPCLALGPAFIFYKVFQTIAFSRFLNQQHISAVPVFYCATEDHDLSEILHAWIYNKQGQIQRIGINTHQQLRSSEVLPWNETLRKLTLLATPEPWRERLDFPDSKSYCEHFIRQLYTIFGKHGLIVAEPRYLHNNTEKFWIKYEDSIKQASHLGPSDMSVFTMNTDSGIRNKLTWDGQNWRAKNHRHYHTKLLNFQNEHTRLSPGCLLRPLLASHQIPTALSVLGPSEMQYQQNILSIFSDFNLSQPILWPRLSATSTANSNLQNWLKPRNKMQERVIQGLQIFKTQKEIDRMISKTNPFNTQHTIFNLCNIS